MAEVIREIHIDAAPEVVREHLTDPDRRSGWLDDGPIEAAPTGTGVTYTRREGDDRARVDIEVLPEGGGSRVRVTEQVHERQELVEPPAPDARAMWAVPFEWGEPDADADSDAPHEDGVAGDTHDLGHIPPMAQAA